MTDRFDYNCKVEMLADVAERLSFRRSQKRYHRSKEGYPAFVKGLVVLQNFRKDVSSTESLGILEPPALDPDHHRNNLQHDKNDKADFGRHFNPGKRIHCQLHKANTSATLRD